MLHMVVHPRTSMYGLQHIPTKGSRRDSETGIRRISPDATVRTVAPPDLTAQMPRLSAAEAARIAQSREPDWLKATIRNVKDEVTLYFRTALAFGLRPRTTASAWVDGRFR